MGKSKAAKRFIGTNRVSFKTDDDDGSAPFNLERVVEEKIEEVQPKEKKVSFQLRCDLPGAKDETANELSRYEVHFKDDYDYMKHLKARDDLIWEDKGMELNLAAKPDLQSKKKDLRAKKKLKKQQPSKESADYDAVEIFPDELDKAAEKDLFEDADVVDELPDNLLDILDGAATGEDFDFMGEAAYNEGEEGDLFNSMAEGEVDYSQMPPLEDFDPESDEDCRSDMSGEGMDVSDEEYEDESDEEPSPFLEKNDDNFPSLLSSNAGAGKAAKKLKAVNDFIKDSEKKPAVVMNLKDFQRMPQEELDRFFDGVADVATDEGGDQDAEEGECPQSGLASSRTAAKDVTVNVNMLNEHFDAMMVREFKRCDVGNEGLEDVGGALDESAPQFRAAMAADRSSHPSNAQVLLPGQLGEHETNMDKELKSRAINYTKNWRETKDKLVEVTIPDPQAMMYNATNFPVIRNKNMPGLIKPDFPLYYKQKKKGLTIKDIKAHDKEMNAPKSNAEDDAQTFKTMITELSYRPPDESSADRRERKTAVKELRRGRREEKKLNKLAHREQVIQTSKVLMHARHYRNAAVI